MFEKYCNRNLFVIAGSAAIFSSTISGVFCLVYFDHIASKDFGRNVGIGVASTIAVGGLVAFAMRDRFFKPKEEEDINLINDSVEGYGSLSINS